MEYLGNFCIHVMSFYRFVESGSYGIQILIWNLNVTKENENPKLTEKHFWKEEDHDN